MVNAMVAALVGGLVGGGAGMLGRHLLRTMRRGVRPPTASCEAGVAVLWATVAVRLAAGGLPSWWVAVPLALGWLAVLLVTCDVLAERLPDALTLPAYPVALVVLGLAAAASGTSTLLAGALVGSALYGGGYALIRWMSPASMGPGDVKLAGSLGAFAGAVAVPAVLASMLTAAVLTLLVSWPRRGSIPHGPAMLAPVWLVTAFPWGSHLHGCVG